MKVLLVDDSPVSLRVLEKVLSSDNYDLVLAKSGAEAWTELTRPDPPRIAIVDWMMPDESGLELCRRIRSRAGSEDEYIYVIIVTAKSDRADMISALSSGADDFIAKPFDPEELKARTRAGARIVDLQNELCERNRALKDYNATVMHDIKTPLIAVKMTISQILEGWFGDVTFECRQALAKTLNSIDDLLQMSENILSLTQHLERRSESKGALDLLALVREVVAELNPLLAARDIQVAVTADGSHTVVTGNRIDLKRVLVNLITNAARHSPGGASIVVSVSQEPNLVSVAVDDSGPGIAEPYREILFKRFSEWTGGKTAHGTGLGLYLCRRIIESHGGSIHYEPGVAGGSRFVFRLSRDSQDYSS